MKITRYFQSCLLIEYESTRILFDPSEEEKQRIGDIGKLDAVLYTHEHSDHFDADLARMFVEEAVAPVYANESTAKLIDASKTIVKDGDELKIGNIDIEVKELPHCLMPNGSDGPQNTGYLLSGQLFIPGDGKEIAGLKVRNLCLPITGPDISMKDTFAFAKQLEAEKVIPIHYDKIGAKPDVYATFAGFFPEFKFKFHVLDVGESTEL